MNSGQSVISCLLAALTFGCVNDPGNDTSGVAFSSSSTISDNPSESVTSAPGGSTNWTVSDGTPTMATATLTGPGVSSTGDACDIMGCGDLPPPIADCDIFAQDCPEGQKCVPYIDNGGSAWNALKCVMVIGTDEPGDPCTSEPASSGIDSCIKGSVCWIADVNGDRICVGLCTGSPDDPVCDPPGFCQFDAEAIFSLCAPFCDPLLQDCTVTGEACYPANQGFFCVPNASGNGGQANDPCEFYNVCDKGMLCVEPALVGMGCPPDSLGCCTSFCKFPGGVCPNLDQQCVQYLDPMQLPPNDPWLEIGFCGIPD